MVTTLPLCPIVKYAPLPHWYRPGTQVLDNQPAAEKRETNAALNANHHPKKTGTRDEAPKSREETPKKGMTDTPTD